MRKREVRTNKEGMNRVRVIISLSRYPEKREFMERNHSNTLDILAVQPDSVKDTLTALKICEWPKES